MECTCSWGNDYSSTFRSDNSRTKKDMKSHFSDLINLLWKPKLPKCTCDLRWFTKVPTDGKNKLCKSTVVTNEIKRH